MTTVTTDHLSQVMVGSATSARARCSTISLPRPAPSRPARPRSSVSLAIGRAASRRRPPVSQDGRGAVAKVAVLKRR